MESSYSETGSSVSPSKNQPIIRSKKKVEEEEKSKSGSREEESSWPRKNKVITLEGYTESMDHHHHHHQESESSRNVNNDDGNVGRTKSLTDEDLEELKGCLDLGFGFSYDEIPELCNILPALELCYSMSQRYLDDHRRVLSDSVAFPSSASSSSSQSQVADWKISSPGDHPDEVKARLKYWAQAVAFTVRLCS